MHIAVRQNLGHRVTHGFADAQLALRAAGGGVFLVVTRHRGPSEKSSLWPGIAV
jgi:hypothetical protein